MNQVFSKFTAGRWCMDVVVQVEIVIRLKVLLEGNDVKSLEIGKEALNLIRLLRFS